MRSETIVCESVRSETVRSETIVCESGLSGTLFLRSESLDDI